MLGASSSLKRGAAKGKLAKIALFAAGLPLGAWLSATAAPRAQQISQPTKRDEPPARIAAFLKSCETLRRGAILQVEHELRGLNREPASPKSARKITELEARLAALRENREPVVPQLVFPPKVGDIGRLPDVTLHVDRVSNDEIAGRSFFPVRVRTVRNFQPRAELVIQEVRLILRDMDRQGVEAGKDVALTEVFEVVERIDPRDAPAAGRVQQFVLRPFDMQAVMRYFRPAVP